MLLACSVFAQDNTELPVGAVSQREVKAETSVEAFRPVGELRTWTFFSKRVTFGQLISVIKETTTIDGQQALIIDQNLQIDYRKISIERTTELEGELQLTLAGSFLGCDYALGTKESTERLVLKQQGDSTSGFFTRGGKEIDVGLPVASGIFSWDPNFADQIEIWLAMQDLKVGDTLIDSLFSPQTMLKTRLVGVVKWFMWQEIYKGWIDSVYVIRLTEPRDYQLYFTADKRLLRVDQINEGIRIYQDLVRPPAVESQEQPVSQVDRSRPFDFRLFVFKLPHFLAYFIVTALAILFLAKGGLKWLDSYLAFGFGAALFVLIPYTQIPLQEYIVIDWLIPAVGRGESIYSWATMPAIVAGLIQEGLKVGALFALFAWRNPKEYRFAILGAFLGGAFGFMESCYSLTAGMQPLFSLRLLERSSLILFHASAAALVGRAILQRTQKLVVIIPLVVAMNTALRYLPIFVQQGAVTVELMHFVLALMSVCFMVLVLFSFRMTSASSQT